jgi:phage terminase Nu1 subunit (DNA packaging protein)
VEKLQFVSRQELSDLIAVPVRTLEDWTYRGIGPTSYKVGRGVRYDLRDVYAWLETHRREGEGVLSG